MNLPLQHRLERVTAPSIDPVTIAECKRHMRIEHSDDDVIIVKNSRGKNIEDEVKKYVDYSYVVERSIVKNFLF